MKRIPEDDDATFAMLSEGRTQGVFQLESAGITGVCVNMKPHSIEDLTAIVALYRPGPMESIPRFIDNKFHPEKIRYRTPLLEPILSVTYGCIVYQEQVIEIFRRLGGYTLGQADMMRRAISKKKQSVIVAERRGFVYGDPERGIPGAIANGVAEDVAQAIYDEILDFANYAFNKAHAVCYAKVAYDTAYLKCHYPRQYMAALMTSVLDSSTKIAGYIAECRDMGIALLPPDINRSEDKFTVESGGIRFGLAAVKNIGKGLIQTVVCERERGGAFTSFDTLCERLSETELSKRAMENLIKCGAMDGFGLRRSQLLQIYEPLMDATSANKRRNISGQIGMFDFGQAERETIPVPDVPELSKRELMAMEKETTGLYLTGHPMDEFRVALRGARVEAIGVIMQSFSDDDGRFSDEQIVSIAGIVQSVRMKTTRNHSMMAYVVLEDDSAAMELLVFSNALEQFGSLLSENSAVVVTGKLSVRDEKEPQMIVNRVRPIGEVASRTPEPAEKTLYLRLGGQDDPRLRKVRSILGMFPGQGRTVVFFADTRTRYGTKCAVRADMLAELADLLGADSVVLK